jgi:hypothetical protein
LRALPDALFVKLLQRVMPKEIAADVTMTGGLSMVAGIELAGLSAQEIRRLA